MTDEFAPKLVEEVDRFSLSMLLDVGSYACLILRQEDEIHAYSISTAEKDALTMCVGTFQPKDAREAILTISKTGLSGTYEVLAYVEGILYNLDVNITA